jgi:hypothetical protein
VIERADEPINMLLAKDECRPQFQDVRVTTFATDKHMSFSHQFEKARGFLRGR